MKLTDNLIKAAKSKSKTYKIPDGHGLYLEVTSKGRKRWRIRYRFERKEQMLSLGTYPDVSLSEARERFIFVKTQILKGIDPSKARKKDNLTWKRTVFFENIAKEWFEINKHKWTKNHAFQVFRKLELNIFPWLGKVKISEITPDELLIHLQRIGDRGSIETAHRVKEICGKIFRYSIATGRGDWDITQSLKDAPLTSQNRPRF